jgi:NAD(P)-dependent dehydrogenase (short-subunit alcohol dehydrogenase family)
MTSEPFDLAGRTALVTGAAGAIGSAVACRFTAAGARVIGLDLQAARNIISCDIADEASVNKAVASVSTRWQVTDLIHCAGVVSVGDVLTTSAAEVRHVLDVNLMSAFIVAQAVGKLVGPGAAMTFLGSQAGVHGAPGWAAYGAAKAGVIRLVEALAKELGPSGVRVNAVCPGTVDSPMTQHAVDLIAASEGIDAVEVMQRYRQQNPLRRIASTEEIAGVCLFLSSPLASFINGASIMVDGGERPG